LQETEGPAGAGPAAYFFPWPGGAPPCPGALPECPGGLVSCPGALPVWPGALPEFPRGLPAWPTAPPECPGGLSAWPGTVSLWLGAVLLWPGALPLSLGDLGVWLDTFPVCPGDVAECPGAFPECPGLLGAWLAVVPLRAREVSAGALCFLPFLACLPLFWCGAFAFLPFFENGHGPIASPWPRWAGRAFRETMIVTNGFFLECVRWQIVTFLGYWDAAAGVRAGDTAAPIDATAPTARAVTPPTAALRPQPHLEDRVISVGSPFDPLRSHRVCLCRP
jgi:hypothetical protein